ncbi:hypothetical protein I1A59_07715 [Streptococcus mitis]|nr:hypothetical protein [Streptococcus sp. NLN76]
MKDKLKEYIITKISALGIFPEVGFDADENFQKNLDKFHKTRGLTIGKEYIALYFVDDDKKNVVITHILSTRSDYLKLFILYFDHQKTLVELHSTRVF